jgi:hypothetical protein
MKKLCLLGIVFAFAAHAQQITGTVHAGVPITIDVHATKPADVDDAGMPWRDVDSIEIHSGSDLMQTIRYTDKENQPRFNADLGLPVTLQDIDCDGYKDLLVSEAPGVHGDAAMYLYRFNVAQGRFVEYPAFHDLFAFKSVSCKTKTLKTYSNDGAAGCDYTSGTYRWVNGKLLPVRIEQQESSSISSRNFILTIRRWNGTKELASIRRTISGRDCHAP